MLQLPPWCDNPEGRALIQQIIADRPEPHSYAGRLPMIYGGYRSGPTTTYVGEAAGRLRRLFAEWQTREFSKLDREFAITHVWDEARSREICGAEDATALVTRVLRETERGAERRAA